PFPGPGRPRRPSEVVIQDGVDLPLAPVVRVSPGVQGVFLNERLLPDLVPIDVRADEIVYPEYVYPPCQVIAQVLPAGVGVRGQRGILSREVALVEVGKRGTHRE